MSNKRNREPSSHPPCSFPQRPRRWSSPGRAPSDTRWRDHCRRQTPRTSVALHSGKVTDNKKSVIFKRSTVFSQLQPSVVNNFAWHIFCGAIAITEPKPGLKDRPKRLNYNYKKEKKLVTAEFSTSLALAPDFADLTGLVTSYITVCNTTDKFFGAAVLRLCHKESKIRVAGINSPHLPFEMPWVWQASVSQWPVKLHGPLERSGVVKATLSSKLLVALLHTVIQLSCLRELPHIPAKQASWISTVMCENHFTKVFVFPACHPLCIFIFLCVIFLLHVYFYFPFCVKAERLTISLCLHDNKRYWILNLSANPTVMSHFRLSFFFSGSSFQKVYEQFS